MSGIVGILNLDGTPVDRDLLRRMTDFMTFRGPDALETWIGGHIGFGHTLLKTTFESEHEYQPFTLDSRVWIVADARVDAQCDLISKLEARGTAIAPGTTDVELILRAYQLWGEECVDHLLGDFAFAIWDGPRKRLVWARDHLGVKPFYYAQLGLTVVFSNTLDCLRQHPAASNKLNDVAIADFLLFGMNQDPETTSFADIQRLPPAHRATWSAGGLKISRYWTLPIDEPLYFKRADDYTDRFRELLDTSVRDRLRTKSLGIFMSGGLDSTTLAASAVSLGEAGSSKFELHAFTSLVDTVADKREEHYASMAADSLGIQIHYRDERGIVTTPNWIYNSYHTPEPCQCPAGLVNDWNEYKEAASYTRVLFYGEGPDNALYYEWRSHLSHLLNQHRFARLALDVGSHFLRHRQIPIFHSFSRIAKLWRKAAPGDFYPNWLDVDFEARLNLRMRWEEEHRPPVVPSPHPVRPVAYRSFTGPLWDSLFSTYDGERTRVPLEVRHPFLDLRVLRYMLALPVIPWCRAKHVVRAAMRGRLPDPVLRRPKAMLKTDPEWEGARLLGLPPLIPVPALRSFIQPERVPQSADQNLAVYYTDLRAHALNYWLQCIDHKQGNSKEEMQHGCLVES